MEVAAILIFQELLDDINSGRKYQALEKFQNTILMGLSMKTDFFSSAAMFGGTSLRIFHSLPRFSEDLDFTRTNADPSFILERYRQPLQTFLIDIGFPNVSITNKAAPEEGAPERGSIVVHIGRSVSLKVKIDIEPCLSINAESQVLYGNYPFQYPANVCKLSSSFAGKMDAVLNREWGAGRVKGRDWYDLLWYCRNCKELNIIWLQERMRNCGKLGMDEELTPISLHRQYLERTAALNCRAIRDDVLDFMTDPLEKVASAQWTPELFAAQADIIKLAAENFLINKEEERNDGINYLSR